MIGSRVRWVDPGQPKKQLTWQAKISLRATSFQLFIDGIMARKSSKIRMKGKTC
jgi:hypothetical protein